MPFIRPLPSYQRQYAGDRYPPIEQQDVLRSQNYRYQPRDVAVREHYQQQGAQRPPASAQRAAPGGPAERSARPPEPKHSNPVPPHPQGNASGSRPLAPQGTAPHEQSMPGSQPPKKSPQAKEPKHEKNADKGEQQDQGSRK